MVILFRLVLCALNLMLALVSYRNGNHEVAMFFSFVAGLCFAFAVVAFMDRD